MTIKKSQFYFTKSANGAQVSIPETVYIGKFQELFADLIVFIENKRKCP